MTTLLELRTKVRQRLTDFPAFASSTALGDGVKYHWSLRDHPLVVDSVAVSVSGAALSESPTYPPSAGTFYLDYDSGALTFGTVPALTAPIVISYQKVKLSDEEVNDAINAGIDYIGGDFYAIASDSRNTLSYTVLGYPIPAGTENVSRVEGNDGSMTYRLEGWSLVPVPTYSVTAYTANYLGDTTSTSLRLTDTSSVAVGDILKNTPSGGASEAVLVTAVASPTLTVTRGYLGTTKAAHASGATWTTYSDRALHFSSVPFEGTLRVTYNARPGNLSADIDTLETTAGLPARAKEPIILYACYWLLSAMQGRKVVKDSSKNLTTLNYSLRDLDTNATKFKMMCDVSSQRLRMKRLQGRAQ